MLDYTLKHLFGDVFEEIGKFAEIFWLLEETVRGLEVGRADRVSMNADNEC